MRKIKGVETLIVSLTLLFTLMIEAVRFLGMLIQDLVKLIWPG